MSTTVVIASGEHTRTPIAERVRRSEHRRALLRSTTTRLVEDFTDLGLIAVATRRVGRAAGLA